MNRVYLIATPEDAAAGEALAEWLARHHCTVRTEFGRFAYPPARAGEVTVALWSTNSLASRGSMRLVNRAIDAWEHDLLVLAKLSHGIPPRGLRDLEMIDLTFEATREFTFQKVLDEVREAARTAFEGAVSRKRARASGGGGPGGGGEERSDDLDRSRSEAPAPASSPAEAPLAETVAPEPLGGAQPAPPPQSSEEEEDEHLFVSYSHSDKEQVYPLVDEAEQMGHPCWIDRDDLEPGERWAGHIVRAIKASRGLWLMCSAQSFSSDHVRREVYLADKYKKPLLPVRLDDAPMPDDIEYFLVDRQWIELAGLSEEQRTSALRAALEDGS